MSARSKTDGPATIGPPKVVILGGGYGGIYTALKLQKAARRGRIHLSLISEENYFLAHPMLAEVVSGSIEPPHIVNPIRRMLPHVHFHQARIQAVEVESRTVVINHGGSSTNHRVQYDHLVIAVGSRTDLSRLPGMAEHAFPFKTLGAAFLAGLWTGFYPSLEAIAEQWQREALFTPAMAADERARRYAGWQDAIARVRGGKAP